MSESVLSMRFALNEPLVASQEIEGETILIHFDSGHYFCSNPTGSLIIERLSAGESVAEVVDILCLAFKVDKAAATAAVQEFVETLTTNGLVVPRPDSLPHTGRSFASDKQETFQRPALEKFDDLQDLLMLDPIHDVDQAGWPLPAPADPTAAR